MMNKNTKIICIGLSKTGTTSLANAMRILGYNVCDFVDHKRTKKVVNLESVEHYDFLSDSPMCIIYKEVRERYPDAKFIHTVRDFDTWIKSIKNEFSRWEWKPWGDGRHEVYEKLYGKPFNFANTYHTYNAEVENAFKDDINYMKFDIFKGDEWQKLCNFLDQPIPSTPFPWKNKKFHKGKYHFKKLT